MAYDYSGTHVIAKGEELFYLFTPNLAPVSAKAAALAAALQKGF